MEENEHNTSKTRRWVPEERRQRIAQLIEEAGSVKVTALEEEFGVSPMTARRDLSILERQGRIVRTHGGAVLPGFARHEDSFHQRLEHGLEAKQHLARAAIEFIEPDETVFVDSSTTSYQVARQIVGMGMNTTVLTNLIPVMELFAENDTPNVELVGVGGELRKLTLSFVGPRAVDTVRAHFADKAVISVKGLTPDGYLTDPDSLEAEVKRSMIERSEEPMLLIEGEKMERRGLSAITHISEIARVLVTGASEDRLQALEQMGVEIHVV